MVFVSFVECWMTHMEQRLLIQVDEKKKLYYLISEYFNRDKSLDCYLKERFLSINRE
jgi:hypothetical protein